MPDEFLTLSEMFELSPVGMLVVDRGLRVSRMNRAIRAINGLSVDDIGTRSIPELLPDVKPQAWDVIREVFATGQPRLDVEITGTTPASRPDQRVWRVSHYPIPDLDGTPTAVGVVVVDVTEQRRAEAARDTMERRLRLLTRASGLIGVSLDLGTTLNGMIDLVVPEFADNSELLLTDEPLDASLPPPPRLELRRVGGATLLPGARPVSATPFPLGERMRIDHNNPAHRAFATRKAILFDVDERVIRSAEFPDRDKFFEYIAVRTAITVPLLVGHEYHGAVYFGLGPSERTYTGYDVQTAAELGSRIAGAVANARAFDRQRRAAVTLQRGLLPGDLPTVEGLDVAWRYEPGTAGTEVGGDWFDVVPLSAGRAALVIGDVMGRGLTAAAVMGQIRTAVRAFAALDLPAADVLTHLDELVQNMGAGPDGALVSCIYAIFEPATASITVANAGHLPPALINPHAGVEFLDGEGGIILGVTGQTLTETCHPFPPGATLVLYTDGLVESPAIEIAAGTRRLRAALTQPGDLHTTADRLLTIIDRDGDYDDDIALLLVRATAPATVRTCVLPADPRSAKTARATTLAALDAWHLREYADLAELLVSELVTNSIRYANSPSHLTLRRGERALHVEVADGDSRVPRLLHPTADDEGGRGLQLVAELATAWGARPTRTGKTVWFQLDTPGPRDTRPVTG
jgi:PAS domain S-box-containing protein